MIRSCDFARRFCCKTLAGMTRQGVRTWTCSKTAARSGDFTSVDRALTGYKTRQNMAVLALDTGQLAEAEQHWREVVRAVPRYRQGWRRLGETLLRMDRFAELDSLAESLSGDGEVRIEGLLMKSRSAEAQEALAVARDALDCALGERPDDWAALVGEESVLFEHGSTDEADEALSAAPPSARRCLGAPQPRNCAHEGPAV